MKCVLIIVFVFLLQSVASSKNVQTNTGKKEFKGNVLCVMTVPSPSHHIWNRSIMRALAKDGYNVTAVSVDIDKEPTENLHYIHLEHAYEALHSDETFDMIALSSLGQFEVLKSFYIEYSLITCLALFKSNGSKTIFQYPRDFKFDLIVFDITTGPCYLPIIDRFPKAPLIGITAFATPPYATEYTGTPLFPSFVPHYSFKHQSEMNLLQRSFNLLVHIVDNYYRKEMIDAADEKVREYFGKEMKYLGSYEKRSEILLVNSHPAMQPLQPLLPNVVQVGGLQIVEPAPLPDDIEKFISAGKKGSVLFSLGTNIKSELLGEEKIQMFINVIRRFPEYNFLWKFESDTLPPIPKNLMIKKWVSQNDILGHPNIKLFLSHCGLLSSQEATWHGVPVLAMPFFADQIQNSRLMLQNGVAEKLDFNTLTEEVAYNTMKKMLENPIYAQNVKRRSIQFRDRPEHPLELAMYWCKYLIRNGNAQHLRSPALEMSHFVQHMWDVLLVLVGVVLGVFLLLSKLICYLSRSGRSGKLKKN